MWQGGEVEVESIVHLAMFLAALAAAVCREAAGSRK